MNVCCLPEQEGDWIYYQDYYNLEQRFFLSNKRIEELEKEVKSTLLEIAALKIELDEYYNVGQTNPRP